MHSVNKSYDLLQRANARHDTLTRRFKAFQQCIELLALPTSMYKGITIDTRGDRSEIGFYGRKYAVLLLDEKLHSSLVFWRLEDKTPESKDVKINEYEFDNQGNFLGIDDPEDGPMLMSIHTEVDCMRIVLDALLTDIGY
jgi:hypothetical protein